MTEIKSYLYTLEDPEDSIKTPWRNGSASDSRSEGCVFKSRRGQTFSQISLSLRYFVLSINGNETLQILE